MVYLIALFSFIMPIFMWIGRDSRGAQELFYQVAGTALVIASFLFFDNKGIKKNTISLFIGIFGVYTVILFFLGGCMNGSAMMINIFISIMIFNIVSRFKVEDTKLILKVVLAVCFLNMAYMGLQQFDLDFIYKIRGENGVPLERCIDLIGLFCLKSFMGIYMGVGMIAMMFFCPIVSILFLVPLYISVSMGAITGAFSGVLFYWYWTRKKIFYLLSILCVIGATVYFIKVDNPMGMTGHRPPFWKQVIKDVVYGYNLFNPDLQSPYLRNPITGFGLNAFGYGNILYFKESTSTKILRGIRTPKGLFTVDGKPFLSKDGRLFSPEEKPLDQWDNCHNIFVQVIYEFGFVGFFLLISFLYYLGKIFLKSIKTKELITITAMLIVYLVSSLTQFPLYLARTGYLVPILLGLFVVNASELQVLGKRKQYNENETQFQ